MAATTNYPRSIALPGIATIIGFTPRTSFSVTPSMEAFDEWSKDLINSLTHEVQSLWQRVETVDSNKEWEEQVVGTAEIEDAAVATAKIADLAVTTAKINDLAVTTAKIDNLAVTSAKINDLSADKITAGTITGSTLQTAASGKRFVVSTADNEAHFYGDQGDTNVVDLCNIGISQSGSDYVILDIGNINSGNTRWAIQALAYSGIAVYCRSVSSTALYGLAASSVPALSGNNSSTGQGVYGISASGYGVQGVGTNTYGGKFTGPYGPVILAASISANAPTHSAELGTLWVTSAGVLYINTSGSTTWAKVAEQHSGSFSTISATTGNITTVNATTVNADVLFLTPGETTTPSHTAALGTLWMGSTAILWVNTSGSNDWQVVGAQTTPE